MPTPAPNGQLLLKVTRGVVWKNKQKLEPPALEPVGAEDLIELGPESEYELVVESDGSLTPAAQVSRQCPTNATTYTPPTYCTIPYYYNTSCRANLCTEYGSPAIRC